MERGEVVPHTLAVDEGEDLASRFVFRPKTSFELGVNVSFEEETLGSEPLRRWVGHASLDGLHGRSIWWFRYGGRAQSLFATGHLRGCLCDEQALFTTALCVCVQV